MITVQSRRAQGEEKMANINGVATTCAVIACLVGTQLTSTASAQQQNFASTGTSSPPATAASAPRLILNDDVLAPLHSSGAMASDAWRGGPAFAVIDAGSFADAGQFRRRGSRGRNSAAAAVIAVGAVASIAGAAVLVYANRPECNTNQLASGCSYGTKVVGGAVLTGGIVGIVAGALAWR
jgi:hypothetical protein